MVQTAGMNRSLLENQYQNLNLEFKNFKPDPEVTRFISSFAEKIHFDAPSDAAMQLALCARAGTVKAQYRIASQVENL